MLGLDYNEDSKDLKFHMTLNNNKLVSVFLVGLLLVSAFGVVQADSVQKKNNKMHPQKSVFEVEQMTIHNWSFIVGPDDTPDRTVYVDPVSISDKTFHLNSKNWMDAGGMANLAATPAKKQAMTQAKDDVQRKKGETVRICIKRIEINNVKIVAKLPEKMPKDMQSMSSDEGSTMSDASQLPSYQITIHRMDIKKWSFIVGTDDTPDDTITLGNVTLEDRTIPLGPSAMKDKRSMAMMQSVDEQVKSGMMKQGAKKGSTYRIIIQNIHLHDVKLVAGNSDEMNDSDGNQSTTETTQTTTQKTTTTEEGMTTTTDQGMTTTTAGSSEDSGSGSDDTNSSDSSGQPGFGIIVSVIACLAAAFLATRKQ